MVATSLLSVTNCSTKVRICYPESFIEKNDQNLPVGYAKLVFGDLWLEKLLDFDSVSVVCYPWWLNDGFLLFLSVIEKLK